MNTRLNEASEEQGWRPRQWHYEADIVVVGYGGAGSAAAIAAHDAGHSVLVLEKAPFGGGNTGCCGGGMRIPRDAAKALAYYRALTQGTVEDESLRAMAVAIHALPARMESWGAELEWIKRGLDYPGLPGAETFGEVVIVGVAESDPERGLPAGDCQELLPGDAPSTV